MNLLLFITTLQLVTTFTNGEKIESKQTSHLRGTTRKLHAVSTSDLSAFDEILHLHDESETELYKQMDSQSTSSLNGYENSTLSDDEIKVLTFNLKVPSYFTDGKNAWKYRKGKVIELIQKIQPTILGTQEGVSFVLEQLQEGIDERHYGRFGAARDPKRLIALQPNEHNQIFYDKSKVEFMIGNNFWLSENPNEPGKSAGFHGNHRRIVTWAKFKLKSTGQEFFVFNTHLDNKDIENGNSEARVKGIDLLIKEMKSITSQCLDTPVIVMGDFNSKRDAYPHKALIEKNGFRDAWTEAESQEGEVAYSFHNWLGVANPLELHCMNSDPGSEQIDFITYYPSSISVRKTSAITEKWERYGEDRYYSDHFPILSYLTL
ncbi:hypothetical protein CTEN210_06846 [Chaetoceros tenuissimus]|uniref:Endonuclease/exonuclease/phosphatase domain-containing protein n=1 Tax=Chaetoceros tenuissimus TaxID=426638 RepID=A0AAD3CT50_9STRA|nr:hypothetical protein CTEN210_06846 [Chaetoceros tenuissimus]